MTTKMKSLDSMSEQELGMLFPVAIVDYCPGWPISFLSEKRRLEAALHHIPVQSIDHIGSTAVPGLAAKPIIDMLIQVSKKTHIAHIIDGICKEDYHYIPQPDSPPPHMMFVKGYTHMGFEGQAFHIHVRYPGDWDELCFKKYLIQHPGAAREYEALKRELAVKFRNYRDQYTEAKTDFVNAVCEKARNCA